MPKVERLRSKVSRRLSFYIHIPYCIKRCGYCDFNTYTPAELQGPDLESVSKNYISAVLKEIELAQKTVGAAEVPSIFFGGGTPSLMPAAELARVIQEIRDRFELSPDIEITIEVNPDSVSLDFLEKMRQAGANRISMGMQSAVPHVLKVLDRTHNPENVSTAVEKARKAGFEHVSVDLIYGAPGESVSDWQQSVTSALQLPIDHISAYALIIEKGTKLAAQISRGEVQMPPDEETAEKYLIADSAFEAAGFNWYELSNWSKPGGQCRHNIAYWNGSMWWGVGPGAHSYFDNRRWWNVKHPATYQQKINAGESPVQSEEILSEENLADEYLMLQIRRREGIPHRNLKDSQVSRAAEYVDSGHLDQAEWTAQKLVLTQQGRLIADRIVRDLVL
ncbi:MAG: coproporphyrinogen III oxidase [Candidatus Nanopelagicaceae bacterium]|nr:coproporphyrinogen III oxidase [Candidatus Nanopelagicaceae bacterium]